MSDLVGDPEDLFSRVAAHMITAYTKYKCIEVVPFKACLCFLFFFGCCFFS